MGDDVEEELWWEGLEGWCHGYGVWLRLPVRRDVKILPTG